MAEFEEVGMVKTQKPVLELENLQKTQLHGPPNLEVPSTALNYDINSLALSDFKDRVAFDNSNFTEESRFLEEMAGILDEAKPFTSFLYTYRSCSAAIPMNLTDKSSKEESSRVHHATFEIIRPQVQMVLKLCQYEQEARKIIVGNMKLLVKPEQAKKVQPEAIVDHIVRCINALVVLDALKDMKACLKNDFSRYKRSYERIRNEMENSETVVTENEIVIQLLNNHHTVQYVILHTLKKDVQNLNNYQLVINLLLEHCADCIEEKRFLMPEEQHMYYRCIPFLIFLLDEALPKGFNPFKSSKVNLGRYQKLFKHFPIIPLYGDMQFHVCDIFMYCAKWDDDLMRPAWITKKPIKLKLRYDLRYTKDKIRNEYTTLCAQVASLVNSIEAFIKQEKSLPPPLLMDVEAVVKKAFQAMSEWSSRIIEQSAWKYANPCTQEEFQRRMGNITEQPSHVYDKRVRLNYTNEDLHALVDVIGKIKGLSAQLMKQEAVFVPLIRRVIHDGFQEFLQVDLARPLRKALKKKKNSLQNTLKSMRDIGGDWFDKQASRNDFKQKKKEILEMVRDFPRRTCSPTITQIALIRRMLWSVCSPKSPGMMGGFMKEKDLKKEWAERWRDFYTKSFFFKYLLDYHQTVRKLADMSHLWYREFYLELTKQVQFPIDMSMPWIMTNFLIETPSMKENVFFPFDVYNDAGSHALVVLKQQFLYDEVEAELNLSFLQLIFHMSEDIFKFYKTVASSILIEKGYRKDFKELKPDSATLINSRYVAVMAQRHVNLLGRTVDIKALLSEHVNDKLRQNIGFIINKFQSQSLTSIVELKYLLDNVRVTHELLSKHLIIDPFESMMKELDMDTSIGRFRGKIIMHAFSEIVTDIMPNFVYNSTTERFVEAPQLYADKPSRDNPKSVLPHFWYGKGYKEIFERQVSMYKGYFGKDHLKALISVLSVTDIPLLISELTSAIEDKIKYELVSYVEVLFKALPTIKLPSLLYGVIASYVSFELKLAGNISRYSVLRSQVFQTLREIGNGVVVLQMLEDALSAKSTFSFQQNCYFNENSVIVQDVNPNEPIPELADPFQYTDGKTVYNIVAKALESLDKNPRQDKGVLAKVNEMTAKVCQIHNVTATDGSILAFSLARFKKCILEFKQSWGVQQASAEFTADLDNPKDFARLYSVLQYIFCQPPPEKKVTDPATGKVTMEQDGEKNDLNLFGEGFSWAGCLILHCLGDREFFTCGDFCSHMLKLNSFKPIPPSVAAAEPKSKKEKALLTPTEMISLPNVLSFLDNAEWIKGVNAGIFSRLDQYLPLDDAPKIVLRPPRFGEEEKVNTARSRSVPIARSVAPASPSSRTATPSSRTATPAGPGAPGAPPADRKSVV